MISVLKSRVEEFLTWETKRGGRQRAVSERTCFGLSVQTPTGTNTVCVCSSQTKRLQTKGKKTQKLTAQTGEVKPSTAACMPSETKGMTFSPRRVSRYRALRMFRACTCGDTQQGSQRGIEHDLLLLSPRSNLRDGGAVRGADGRGPGQRDQLSHGHFQQAATGRLGLGGEQSLRR